MIKEPGDCKDVEDAGFIQRGQLPLPHQLIIARCNVGPELPALCNLFREAGISGFFFFFFWLCWVLAAACGVQVPGQGLNEPGPPALGVWSINHWTAREVPRISGFLYELS